MKFFSEKAEKKKGGVEPAVDGVLLEPSRENFTVSSFLEVIADVEDEEDLYFFQNKAAEKMSLKLAEYVREFSGKESVGLFISFLNFFLERENLGSVNYVKVDLSNKKFVVAIENSAIALALKKKYKKKVCKFYETLLSELFSDLIGVDIKFKEIQCLAEEGQREKICIFEST